MSDIVLAMALLLTSTHCESFAYLTINHAEPTDPFLYCKTELEVFRAQGTCMISK